MASRRIRYSNFRLARIAMEARHAPLAVLGVWLAVVPKFDVSGLDRLPRVVLLASYLGPSGDLVRAARDPDADGIGIAVAGTGATTPSQDDAIDEVIADGVVVDDHANRRRPGTGPRDAH